MPKYSIVVPVYNEEVFLSDFYKNLIKSVKEQNAFEIIFVNDGSTDYSPKILNKIADENPIVKVVNLKKNYGKQIAITAGMKETSGDAVIVLTIKPGSPYEAIDALISSYQRGNEIVLAYRNKKQSKLKFWWRGVKRRFLEWTMRLFKIKGNLVPRPDAELYDRKVVDILNELPDKNMYLRRVDIINGYSRDYVYFESQELSKKELDEIKMHKFDFIGERIINDEREPKKLKKRYYTNSLWASFGLFIATALLILGLAFETIFTQNMLLIIITALITICTALLSIVYYFKSILIKRLGIMLPKNTDLYEISNIIN